MSQDEVNELISASEAKVVYVTKEREHTNYPTYNSSEAFKLITSVSFTDKPKKKK